MSALSFTASACYAGQHFRPYMRDYAAHTVAELLDDDDSDDGGDLANDDPSVTLDDQATEDPACDFRRIACTPKTYPGCGCGGYHLELGLDSL